MDDDGVETRVETAELGGQYLVTCSGKLPQGFESDVASNGDTVVYAHADAGFAVIETTDATQYETRSCDIVTDEVAQWVAPVENVAGSSFGDPPASGDDDFFFDLQWGHDAVDAPQAWNAGVRGAGVRVAVLDTGFDLDHPDLAPNIDFATSADFTGEGLNYIMPGPFSHGTHTAGTVAAADNGFGTIGVAPEAELVLVKVLSDVDGSGSFGTVLTGMLYANAVGADIISMSLGATFPRTWDTGQNKLIVAMNRVAAYIKANGSLIIAAAGNEGIDFDHPDSYTFPDGTVVDAADWISMPSGATGVVSISATAPRGWLSANGSTFDYLASYSNYGRSAIDFSGPGGDIAYPGNEFCFTNVGAIPCWVLDLVFSTGNGGWYWSAGTSMATPHAAGIAALIASENDSWGPARIEREMRNRSHDWGVPGNDPVHGHGHVASGY